MIKEVNNINDGAFSDFILTRVNGGFTLSEIIKELAEEIVDLVDGARYEGLDVKELVDDLDWEEIK